MFDIILSDVQMPGKINGIELAEFVAQTLPSQRIALMTGYANELDRARLLGITILSKPFNMEELMSLLSGLESGRRPQDMVA